MASWSIFFPSGEGWGDEPHEYTALYHPPEKIGCGLAQCPPGGHRVNVVDGWENIYNYIIIVGIKHTER